MKKKKISFNFSIKKTSKPKKNELGEEVYPVYLKVIFNRHSTRFILPDYIQHGEQNSPIREITLKEYEEKNFNLDSEIESYLEKIVRFEYGKVGEKYLLNGLNERAMIYNDSVSKLLLDEITNLLLIHLGDHFSYNDFSDFLKGYKEERLAAFSEEMLYFEHSFINKYLYYQARRDPFTIPYFPLIDILPDRYKKQVGASLIFLVFHYEFLNSDCKIIDWLSNDSLLRNFKNFLELDYSFFLKEMLLKHPNFQKTLQDFFLEVKDLTSNEIISIVNKLVNSSSKVDEINTQLEKLKKGG